MTSTSEPAEFHTHVYIHGKKSGKRHPGEAESHHDGWVVSSFWSEVGHRLEPTVVTIESRGSWRKRAPADWVTDRDPIGDGDEVPQEAPVTANAVRTLPLGAILAEARRGMRELADRFLSRFPDDSRSRATELFGFGPMVGAQRGAQRGRRLTDSDLQDVAVAYREAWAYGAPVNEAVRERCKLSRDGAAKRIMAARKAGLLDDVGPKR